MGYRVYFAFSRIFPDPGQEAIWRGAFVRPAVMTILGELNLFASSDAACRCEYCSDLDTVFSCTYYVNQRFNMLCVPGAAF